MRGMNYAMKQTVPYYSQAKKALALNQKQKKRKNQPRTLTEYSESGSKPVLRHGVTVNQAARKLHEYEQTGLSPREIMDLITRADNLAERVRKLESWD